MTIHCEFLIDGAYLQEFHREWVATSGKGWRDAQRLALTALGGALGLASLGWLMNRRDVFAGVALLIVFASVVLWSLRRRKAAWVRHCESLPWHGKVLRIEVRDGDLVQVKDFPGSLEFQRTGALVLTPNGYLVKYQGQTPPNHAAISSTSASIYIRHKDINPAMSRQEFLAQLELPQRGSE